MTLQRRIQEAIRSALEKGKTLADIARECEVSAAAVTQWKDGTTKSLKAESAVGLEVATGYRAMWLVRGKGHKFSGNSWPFELFNEMDYKLLDESARQEIEDSIAGKIQRARMKPGNAPPGRGYM